MPAAKILLITLLFLASNTTAFYLRNFSQVQSFCGQFGFQFSSKESYMVQNSIGQWAAAQGNKEASFWLSACYFTTTNHEIPATTTTTTVAPTPTPVVNNYDPLVYIGSSVVMGTVKDFYGNRYSTSWKESYELCKVKGLKLASLETAEDQEVLTKWADNNSEWSGFWTAGTNVGSPRGIWTWATSGIKIPTAPGAIFEFWRPQQSEPFTNPNLCIVSYLWSGRTWYATPCVQLRPALCETPRMSLP